MKAGCPVGTAPPLQGCEEFGGLSSANKRNLGFVDTRETVWPLAIKHLLRLFAMLSMALGERLAPQAILLSCVVEVGSPGWIHFLNLIS